VHSASDKRNRRILIVDDNEAIHEDFNAILAHKTLNTSALDQAEAAILGGTFDGIEQETFDVDSAFQGKEGLEKIQQALQEDRPYAMAFVDVRMPPGWDGIETIQRIWKEYPDLQVVICTAYSDYEWHEVVKKLGRTEKLLFLKKPFEREEVYQLAVSLTEKWHLSRQARLKYKELEQIVEQRTRELEEANRRLTTALAKAEEADRAKSRFLANMSHEIRTPMNAIVGFSSLLSEEDLTDAQQEDVTIVRESAKNLLNLINDILDFSKIEAGQLTVEMMDCSLGQLLSSLESMMKPQAIEKSIDFRTVQAPNLPGYIKTDPHRLKQCLVNLVNNALKFTEQGHVHVKVSLHEDNGKHLIRFDVADTGIGIPKHRQAAIFESFTQADGSTTRKYGGTGLGLTVTKQLIELLRGELALTSDPGKGSVFSIVIPAGVDVTGQAPLDQDSTLYQRAEESGATELVTFSGKVLLAEDVKTNQILMKSMLTKMGLEVAIAEDGNQALQAALSQSFDLIFMDMQMPNMNGYEAARQIRKAESADLGFEIADFGLTEQESEINNEKGKLSRVPIVALTADAMKGDDQKCIAAGCDDYLAKPIDCRELSRTIGKHLLSKQDASSQTIAPASAQTPEPSCSPQVPSPGPAYKRPAI